MTVPELIWLFLGGFFSSLFLVLPCWLVLIFRRALSVGLDSCDD